jgi:hypothetical protein
MTDAGEFDSTPILHEEYRNALRVHAVSLIVLGYRRLGTGSLATAEEDDITGELVRNMRLVVADPASPDWVEHYEIREQVPQNVSNKLGKRRPRIDVEIERNVRGARPCLGFEAKRLGRGGRVSEYLGKEGLGAFLSGHYSTTHGEAGMLGYMQENDTEHWCSRFTQELERGAHRLAANGAWNTLDSILETPLYSSTHTDSNGKPLFIVHLLLSFKI